MTIAVFQNSNWFENSTYRKQLPKRNHSNMMNLMKQNYELITNEIIQNETRWIFPLCTSLLLICMFKLYKSAQRYKCKENYIARTNFWRLYFHWKVWGFCYQHPVWCLLCTVIILIRLVWRNSSGLDLALTSTLVDTYEMNCTANC